MRNNAILDDQFPSIFIRREVPLLFEKWASTTNMGISPADAAGPIAHKMALHPVSAALWAALFVCLALIAVRFKLTSA
ncbi:hypothetical protein CCR90_10430 [Rhodovulum sulfidophilum]|nr:hypothetical protein [Rhodovulum sulfidophilum]